MLGPGDFFGEMALPDTEPRSWPTAIADEASELSLRCTGTDFQGVVADNPAISAALIKVLLEAALAHNHQISTARPPRRLRPAWRG